MYTNCINHVSNLASSRSQLVYSMYINGICNDGTNIQIWLMYFKNMIHNVTRYDTSGIHFGNITYSDWFNYWSRLTTWCIQSQYLMYPDWINILSKLVTYVSRLDTWCIQIGYIMYADPIHDLSNLDTSCIQTRYIL